MSNKKISALTAATTPLAGSEVVPIVQSSSTVKVSIDNLTAGKTVQALNLLVNTASNPGTFNNGVIVNSGTGLYAGLQLINNLTGSAYNSGIQLFTNGTAAYLANFSNDSIYVYQNGYNITYQFAPNGDLTLKTGNLIQGTAAKGINFTANTPAAGMTSQLLNWYEEGTWTPTDASGAGLSLTVNYAKYTRIGRQVSFTANITYPSNANATPARIGGFPFAATDAIFANVNYTSVSTATFAYFSGSSTEVYLLTPGVNTTNAQMTGAAVIFSGTYFT